MRRCLDRYVKTTLYPSSQNVPPKTNKRFFPRLKTIRSHMLEALKKLRYSKIDQECLAKKVEQWQHESPSDKFYFQPKSSRDTENSSNSENFVFLLDITKSSWRGGVGWVRFQIFESLVKLEMLLGLDLYTLRPCWIQSAITYHL